MSDDLIKREDAMQVAFLYPFFSDALMEEINAIPSADRSQGEWKRRIVDNGFNADWVCSECGYRVKTDFVDYKFCPNCGADMRKRASVNIDCFDTCKHAYSEVCDECYKGNKYDATKGADDE